MMAPHLGSDQYNMLNDVLTEVNAEFRFPAVAASVASAADVLATGAIGAPIATQAGAVTANSQFHIGSITKAMTATAIATIVEAGALRWTTRPADILPGLHARLHPAFRDIQLQHLLTHRAGIPPFAVGKEFEALERIEGTPREQRAWFASYLLQREPAAKPLADFLYSNAGYAIAAAMAEQVTAMPWETLIAERLLTPLGLASAGIGWPARTHPNAPWGHFAQGEDFIPHPPDDAYQLSPLIAPAGDLHMSALDLVRFGQMHLRGLLGDDTLVRADTMHTLHTPFGDYSFGWNESSHSSQHSGSAGTFFAVLVLMPQDNRAYAFVTNACDYPAGDSIPAHAALASAVLRALREQGI